MTWISIGTPGDGCVAINLDRVSTVDDCDRSSKALRMILHCGTTYVQDFQTERARNNAWDAIKAALGMRTVQE